MDLFKLEPGLAIWTWISFGLLLIILAKFVIPSILKNLQEREDYIHSSVDKTAEIEKRLSAIESERDAKIEDAGAQADKILLQVRSEAEELKKKLTAQAEKEAEELIEQARKQLESERRALIEAMRQEITDFVVETSEKVVGSAFVGDKEKAFTKDLVDTL